MQGMPTNRDMIRKYFWLHAISMLIMYEYQKINITVLDPLK